MQISGSGTNITLRTDNYSSAGFYIDPVTQKMRVNSKGNVYFGNNTTNDLKLVDINNAVPVTFVDGKILINNKYLKVGGSSSSVSFGSLPTTGTTHLWTEST